MPLHEYSCDACGERFELLVRKDTTLACPQCGEPKLTKLFSAFAVGSGGNKNSSAFPQMAGPCGSCGHPDGPGSCSRKS